MKKDLKLSYANMPRITFLKSMKDYGEYGAAECPHCGAKGRYVYEFICDDGSNRGAMRICFSRWPQHYFVREQLRIEEKSSRFEAQGWGRLSEWDTAPLEAIQKFARGEITEAEAEKIVDAASQKRAAYAKSKYGR